MAMFNYKGNTSRSYGGLPIGKSTPIMGSGKRPVEDLIAEGSRYSQPMSAKEAAGAAGAAKSRATSLYDTPEYQIESAKSTGLTRPSTYNPDDTLRKPTQSRGTSTGGSSGGGGVVYTGGGTGSTQQYDYSTIKDFLAEAEGKYAERSKMQLDNWETALQEAESRFSALESSPLYQSLRSTAQGLLGGELTSSQKAAVGSAMRDVSRTTGESYLARGLGGSGMATAETAGAQGQIAARTADIVRQNQLAGLEAGTALEGQYQNQLNQLMMFREGEIRPLDIQLPDYTQQAELLGKAAASSGTGGAASGTGGTTSGAWRQTGKLDFTKEGKGLKWKYVTPEQLAKEQEARDAGYSSLSRYEAAQQWEAYRESLRAKARAKGKNI